MLAIRLGIRHANDAGWAELLHVDFGSIRAPGAPKTGRDKDSASELPPVGQTVDEPCRPSLSEALRDRWFSDTVI